MPAPDSLLDAAVSAAPPSNAAQMVATVPPSVAPARTRPEGVPEKFWDAGAGQMRVDALLKSYLELERAMSRRYGPPGDDATDEDRARFRGLMGIPDAPDGYAITPPHEKLGPDPEVNARLHAAGFTPSQAQLVYDLAAERLMPVVAEAAQQYEAQRQLDRLRAEFGGEERFARVARQVSAWGRANLAPEVFEALSTTAEGVMALHRMMERGGGSEGGEPTLSRKADVPDAQDEAGLRSMMRDPRYWRTREPEFVKRVTEGFRRLTGG